MAEYAVVLAVITVATVAVFTALSGGISGAHHQGDRHPVARWTLPATAPGSTGRRRFLPSTSQRSGTGDSAAAPPHGGCDRRPSGGAMNPGELITAQPEGGD